MNKIIKCLGIGMVICMLLFESTMTISAKETYNNRKSTIISGNTKKNTVSITGNTVDKIEDDFDNDGIKESFIVTTTEKDIPEDRFEYTFSGTKLWYVDNGIVSQIIPDKYLNTDNYLECRSYTLKSGEKIVACSYNLYKHEVEDISDEIYVFENGKFVSKGIFGYTNVEDGLLKSCIESSYSYRNSNNSTSAAGKMDRLEQTYKYVKGKFVEDTKNGKTYSEDDIKKMVEKYAGVTSGWWKDHEYGITDYGNYYYFDFYYVSEENGHHQYDLVVYKGSGKGYMISSLTDWIRPTEFIDFSVYAK